MVAPEPIDAISLDSTELYLNRELSLLRFHERVLAQATRTDVPLLERLRFLVISCTNLDEFFEVRVASIKQQTTYGVAQPGIDGRTPSETLREISVRAHALVAKQYQILNDTILPQLRENGIRLLRRSEWTERQAASIRSYFEAEVLPLLTPTALDPAHPFPNIVNKRLNFIVDVKGRDAFGRPGRVAIVTAPQALPRVINLGPEASDGPNDFVLLSSVIHANMDRLFTGMQIASCHQFRVTRNSDLWIDEEEVDDLLNAIAGELPRRNFGDAVRLEVDDTCSPELATFLLEQMNLSQDDLYQGNGPVNLHRVGGLIDAVEAPGLKFAPFVPQMPPRLANTPDIFGAIREAPILLHHPFESFTPVLELLHMAATDPDVLAIKMTLYRTGTDSPVANALLEAARAGKEVTVVVELRARFDEAANIDWATRFKAVGATVCYGIVGFKTHAKMLLIVRREVDGLRRYVHLGTGNYHSKTTRAYTDFGLLSAGQDVAQDVHELFLQLTGFAHQGPMRRLLPAPLVLLPTLLDLIEAEIAAAQAGKKARIIAKLNALSEPTVIKALYRASQAGVEIDLLVRGICCLRPGIKGVSETIRVRSIVGRFLEHSRIYYFWADGREETVMASADWMPRNLQRRVESAIPVDVPELKQRLRDEGLRPYLEDTLDAWELQPDGSYTRIAVPDGQSAQALLIERHAPVELIA